MVTTIITTIVPATTKDEVTVGTTAETTDGMMATGNLSTLPVEFDTQK
jgi:hypothetical protein